MKTKYTNARSVLYFLLLIGWLGFVGGAVTFGIAWADAGPVMVYEMTVSLGAIASGLTLIALGSVGVGILDTADETRRTNLLLRSIAERQGVDVVMIDELAAGKASLHEYLGETIAKRGNRYHWDGESYRTLGKAKAAIKSARQAA